MVLSFFRRPEPGLMHISAQVVAMLGDSRHSFEVATNALLFGSASASVIEDVEVTDARINQTEYDLRRELVVHVAVQGTIEIGQVLGFVLLIKKIERIGDQAKNILELATDGVSLAGADDVEEFVVAQRAISSLFHAAGNLLSAPDEEAVESIRLRALELDELHTRRIRELLHSGEPGAWAVPRAMLHRYLKRIVANLSGIATTLAEPIPAEAPDIEPLE